MSESQAAELRRVKKELASSRRQLKEALALNERLRATVGCDELQGWEPQDRIEKQYGWVFAWLYPLRTYINQNLGLPLTPEVRNKIHAIVAAVISQLVIHGKYGIDVPADSRPVDVDESLQKQQSTLRQTYEPCAICGETRITDDCHIIPRSEGGPWHRDNLLTLCPLHHHLFDHSRLSEAEWNALKSAINDKMEAAVRYAYEVRLPNLQQFWLHQATKCSKEELHGPDSA